MDFLAKKYNLLGEDIIDVLPPTQASKLVERPDYLFMILLFPIYDREEKRIRAEEINFFIAKNFLISIHANKIPIIKDIYADCQKNIAKYPDLYALLYEMLGKLLNYCFPMLRHINEDIEMIEGRLFKQFEKKETVEKILRVKTNIFDFERSVKPHDYVLKKLVDSAGKFFPAKKLEKNFIVLAETAKEISLSVDSYKDAINALHEASATLVEYRVNQIIKILTIFSLMTFPLTLVATLFSMKTISTPIVGSPFDFWKITGGVRAGAITLLVIFKVRKWI